MEDTGYAAIGHCDGRDRILHARLQSTGRNVCVQGLSVAEPGVAFREAAGDYPAHCDATGRVPTEAQMEQKEGVVAVTVEIDSTVHSQANTVALQTGVGVDSVGVYSFAEEAMTV